MLFVSLYLLPGADQTDSIMSRLLCDRLLFWTSDLTWLILWRVFPSIKCVLSILLGRPFSIYGDETGNSSDACFCLLGAHNQGLVIGLC